ncbi:MAG: LysE family translocator [Thermomicrobiales bacterium]
MDLFLRGLLIGLAIAAPVGAIGVLCIRRTLADGRLAGLFTGLGAATADALYGAVAGFGLTGISELLVDRQHLIRVIGGIFLLWLGWKTWVAPPPDPNAPAPPASLGRAWATTFALTLTNPLTVLSFAAVFAGLGLAGAPNGWRGAMLLVAGVFSGSALWWLILSGGVSLVRDWFTPARMLWVNRVSGAVIAGFGVLALVSEAARLF